MLIIFMEVFMDDSFVFGSSFDACFANLSTILRRCEEVKSSLKRKKESFDGPRRNCFGP